MIDKFIGNCTSIPLEDEYDTSTLPNSGGLALTLRDPKQFFYIDDTYFFAGQVHPLSKFDFDLNINFVSKSV